MQVTCTSTTDFSGAGVHEILERGMEQIERNFFLPFVATYEKPGLILQHKRAVTEVLCRSRLPMTSDQRKLVSLSEKGIF